VWRGKRVLKFIIKFAFDHRLEKKERS
jgi:hypothetical protein